MYRVAVLVVTYNRKKLLLENAKAILKQTFSAFDYYIIDNNSSDGTEETIKELFLSDARIHYIKLDENIGGAGGFCYGLRLILEKEYKYTWIMDDDAIPEPNALEILIQEADKIKKDEFSYLASKVLWTDGSICLMNKCVPAKKEKKNLLYTQDRLTRIEHSSFVGCFVNNHIARQVGLPIADFFIYMDDVEYTLRLGEKAPAFYVENSIIIHKTRVNSSAGIELAPPEKLDRYRYAYRNRIYCYRYRWKMKWLKITILYMLETWHVLRKSKSMRFKRIRIIWSGYMKGWKYNPPILFS